MRDIGHWETKLSAEDIDKAYGFIYIIKNKKDGKFYIGKKQIRFKRTQRPLKGKKRKRISYVESDWKSYCGSSNKLLEDIERLGKDSYSFQIVKLCSCKWELAYEELKMQMKYDVLDNDLAINGIINVRLGKKPKSMIGDL